MFGMKYECLHRSLILNPIVAFEEWDDSRKKHHISDEKANMRITVMLLPLTANKSILQPAIPPMIHTARGL